MRGRKPQQTHFGIVETLKGFFPGFEVNAMKDVKKNHTDYVISHENEAVLIELARQLADEPGPKIRLDNGQPKTVSKTEEGYNLHINFDDYHKLLAHNEAGMRIVDGYTGFKIDAKVLERQWLHQVDDVQTFSRPSV